MVVIGAPRYGKTRPRAATRIRWLDFCRNWFAPVFARNCNCDLHPDRGPLACETYSLLVRIRYGLHRMSLPSLRNNSWGIHHYRPFTRVREDVVLNRCVSKERPLPSHRGPLTARSLLLAVICRASARLARIIVLFPARITFRASGIYFAIPAVEGIFIARPRAH
jgi:hypothetical protein